MSAPRIFLQGLVSRPVRIHFARPESAAAEGVLDGFDGLGVVIRRADRLTFYPWHVLRSIEETGDE